MNFDTETFISKINELKSDKNNNIELELLYLIDERNENKKQIENNSYRKFNLQQTIDISKQLIKKYSDETKIEYSINFITNDNKIRNVPYINGEQQKEKITFYEKKRIINNMFFISENNLPSYKLKISNEKRIKEFEIKECTFARIKLRHSSLIQNWRLDITLIKNVYNLNNIEEIKNMKNKMFNFNKLENKLENTEQNFIKNAPWNYCDKIEIELEYISNLNKFNLKDLIFADEIWNKINLYDSIDSNLENKSNQTNNLENKSKYQSLIYKIAKIIIPKKAELYKEKYGIKKLSSQVIDIDKNTFINKILIDIDKYYITDKVDGERTIIFIENNILYAISSELKIINLGNKENENFEDRIILDTEYYNGKYYVFDILKFNDELIIYKPFKDRLKYFDKIKLITYLKNIIEYKPFIKLTKNYYEQIKFLYEQKKEYETDGFIINPEEDKYFEMVVYKIKPIEKSTIDFLIVSCPEKLYGIKPYIKNNMNLYCLLCGINKIVSNNLNLKYNELINDEIKQNIKNINYANYFPIQFETSDYAYPYLFWSNENLNYKIGEFRIDLNLINYNNITKNQKASDKNFISNINNYIINQKNIWQLIKIRTDREVELKRGNYFGNNYRTADMIWQNYQNPLLIEELIIPPKYDIYFNFDKSKSNEYKASRAFNSYVKTKIFNNFNNAKWCLDIASGNGQDLFRYNKVGVKNLLNLEIDKTALQELNFRKHEFSNNIENKPMTVKTMQIDLNENYKINLEFLDNMRFKLPVDGFNYIICNFAFHYLIQNKKNIQNIIKFISSLLQVKGKFIMTCFDGKKIFELLNQNNGKWEQDQYLIKFKEEYKNLEEYGQIISLKLPFSKDKIYDEYLVNIEYLKDEFKKNNLIMEINNSFSDYFDDYSNHKSNYLSDSDKIFTSLYHYYSFYKCK